MSAVCRHGKYTGCAVRPCPTCAEIAQAVKSRDALLKEAHDVMDTVNGDHGEEGRLCLFCGQDKYNGKEGIIHNPDCIIKRIRVETKALEAK